MPSPNIPMKNHIIRATVVSTAALICFNAALQAVARADGSSAVRIVACDAPVKSVKRGICLNQMDAKDFMALSPGVSWWYNWHYKDTQNPPAAAGMEFLPMAWGDRAEDLEGLKAYLATHKPSRVLAINEPNLKGQAFISPEQTAAFYKKVKAAADVYNIPVIGPNMALGSGAGDSITAMDPIEKKEISYTFMTPFIKAFNSYVGDTEVPAVAAHTYGNFGELKWMTEMMNKEFNKPVWVTEFAQWGAADAGAERDYLIQAVDLFERAPYVQGYAWFKERVEGNPKLSLLEKESGKLTPLGETYVSMPVHDPKVYYRLPGRLQAESYLRLQDADIAGTGDVEGFLEMRLSGANAWLEYNVAVKEAGTLTVRVRFFGDENTKIEILAGERALATVQGQGREKGWQTVSAPIVLPAGNQTLQVRSSGSARLNWMEFKGR